MTSQLELEAKQDEIRNFASKIRSYEAVRDALETELGYVKHQLDQMKETVQKHESFGERYAADPCSR